MSKIIKKTPENSNPDLPIISHATSISVTSKLPFLQKITYLIFVLNFFLGLFILYYEKKIPWFTTGIDNVINIIKPIIPGGGK